MCWPLLQFWTQANAGRANLPAVVQESKQTNAPVTHFTHKVFCLDIQNPRLFYGTEHPIPAEIVSVIPLSSFLQSNIFYTTSNMLASRNAYAIHEAQVASNVLNIQSSMYNSPDNSATRFLETIPAVWSIVCLLHPQALDSRSTSPKISCSHPSLLELGHSLLRTVL